MTKKLSIIAKRLSQSEVFNTLSDSELLDIAEFCSEEIYQDNCVVFKENEPANSMLVVERGKLAIEKKIQVGRQSTPRNATIAYVSPNQVAGFSTIAFPHTHTASVIAIEPTRVLTIEGQKLRQYLASNPEAGYKVVNALVTL
ncbi:MAG: cyclic nucleotide-binding domain-containing protein, partial [Chloroflexota bacterium]|nr:cyclic nucleotide-binding domain-containing protein [Chloroflexota bacterium]